jgi:hypothetical protein
MSTLLFHACDTNDSVSHQLIGTWKMDRIYHLESEIPLSNCVKKSKITFYENGNLTYNSFKTENGNCLGQNNSGKWILDDQESILSLSYNSLQDSMIPNKHGLMIAEEQLELWQTHLGDSIHYTYKRVE